MKSNKTMGYVIGCLTISSIFLSPQVHADMSVKQALELTANNNPQLLGDKASARSKKSVIRRAEAGYLPKIDASISAGYEHVRDKFWATNISSQQIGSASRFRQNPSITIIQNVFDGFKTKNDVNKARSDYIQGEKKVDESLEQLSFRAFNAYADVRRFQRLLRVAKENLAAQHNISGKAEQLIKAGRTSVADRYTIQSRLATAKNAIIEIQGDLDTAVAQFISIIGVEPGRLSTSKIPDEHVPKTLDEALRIAREHNKSVILARASVDVATAELNSTESAFWPTVSIEANANKAKNNDGLKGHSDRYNVLGVVRYNIYNGGADSARVTEAVEKVSEQRYRTEAQMRTAEEETRKSWSLKVSSEASSRERRTAVEALTLEADTFQKQYDLGTRTLIDVVGAINEKYLVQGALITSDAAQDTATARLLASMGVLTDRFDTCHRSPKLLFGQPVDELLQANKAETAKYEGKELPCHKTDESTKPLAADDMEELDITTLLQNLASEETPEASIEPAAATENQESSTDAYQADSGITDWVSSVFSSNETESKEDLTTISVNAKEETVTMGPGIAVPPVVKSGQSIP
jgi:adhesin transport system outer membrane protein